MKKLIFVLLAVVMLFSFAACDNTPDKEVCQPDDTSDVQTNQKETFGINETAVFEDLKITATDMEVSNGKDFFTPKDGNVFVGIKFEIENCSQQDQAVSSLLLFDDMQMT